MEYSPESEAAYCKQLLENRVTGLLSALALVDRERQIMHRKLTACYELGLVDNNFNPITDKVELAT